MSDPVSNAEIEDVLSSIRRLVSVDDRPDLSAAEQPDPSETMDADRSHGGAGNRLVLTPALRVDARDTDPQPDPQPDAESQAEPVDSAPDTADQDPPAEDPDASALQFSHSEFEQEQQDTADDTAEDSAESHGPDEADSAASDDASDNAASEDAAQADGAPYVLDQTQAADPSQAPGLGDRIAEVEAAVAAQDDQWEPDGESDDAYSGGAVSPMAWEDYGPEPTYDDADDADGDEPINDDMENVATEVSSASGMADDQLIEPSDETAGSSGPDAWQASEARDEAPGEASLWDDDRADTVIDEEALRDMVSEIVRQELQGALGERITRNVRKLVRREIHRALSSHELD